VLSGACDFRFLRCTRRIAPSATQAVEPPGSNADSGVRREEYLDSVYPGPVCLGRMAIQSFARPEVEVFFIDGTVPRRAGWGGVKRIARRKLDMIDYAEVLADLASPPGNRLETLKGDLAGCHSIRVNDQWRIVFRWTASGPAEVDIRDYH
jgi:proteic killer suppression protein